jgi:hypothetical protein
MYQTIFEGGKSGARPAITEAATSITSRIFGNETLSALKNLFFSVSWFRGSRSQMQTNRFAFRCQYGMKPAILRIMQQPCFIGNTAFVENGFHQNSPAAAIPF